MSDLFYDSYTAGTLDPFARQFLTAIAAADLPSLNDLTPAEARKRNIIKSFGLKPAPVASVTRFTIPGKQRDIPVRIYFPHGDAPFAALIYLHGGGWVVGTPEDFEPLCSAFCQGAGIAVVSVDYALAPETRFPGALEECYNVLCWLYEHGTSRGIDPDRLMVGGDSAGANLSAALTLLARDREGPRLSRQLLICPAVNLSDFNTASYHQFGSGIWVSLELMQWYINHYLSHPPDAANPLVSPLLSPDLSCLPAAMILTAEFDILRDEGEAYASRLVEAGVPVTLKRYPGQIHDFLLLGKVMPMAKTAIMECNKWLR